MSNIVVALKDEISRLARKEIKNQTKALRKITTQHRKAVAEMKRRISELERQVTFLKKQLGREIPSQVSEADVEGIRFSARGLRSHRKRRGLSAAAYGKIIGVTGQTVYQWESETVRPRKQQLTVLAALRRLGKREAQARVEELTQKSPKKR